ncbi:T9SS type A sorting domain-containing protein [Flavobacterium sp. SUN052]|uniref:T9SS type A sorting domain-containing protein n=1 Tax=Flavobacterium sp. SUN052 TaxID=3002441 RepID=UPI00237E6F54|nr:T9SS type A sorting domain-containing protein [Flavobacterium sp. SUN052]MEC4005633.1 T9SS type A sorting domain-containing protein [Flavobacterium sp. SUN052]
MKKTYLFFLIIIINKNYSQTINFQDVNFKNALLNTICIDSNGNGIIDADADTNNDGEIDHSEIASVTFLNVSNNNITSLQGIENFINLRNLECSSNLLTNLDASSLSNLTFLSCNNNFINSLNINNLNYLERLTCGFNQLTTLNFQNHPSLNYVICGNNLFSELNMCGSGVSFLWCNDNPNLTTLILKNGVISNLNTYSNKATPPSYPLPQLRLDGLPSLNYLCYDVGELAEINFFAGGFVSTGVTLVSDCDSYCLQPILPNMAFENNSIKIFPNPTNHWLYFESTSNNVIEEIKIYNTLGQLMGSKKANNVSYIDVSELNFGTYIIEIQTINGKVKKKFIKL